MGQYQLMSAQLSVSVTTIARNNLENPAIFKDQQQVAEALAVARRQTEIHHTTHRFQFKKRAYFTLIIYKQDYMSAFNTIRSP